MRKKLEKNFSNFYIWTYFKWLLQKVSMWKHLTGACIKTEIIRNASDSMVQQLFKTYISLAGVAQRVFAA